MTLEYPFSDEKQKDKLKSNNQESYARVTPLPDIILGEEIYYPKIDHPKHYNAGKFETIDVIEDWSLDFHCGNAIKYISRHKYKDNPAQDIEKAVWYLNRYLQIFKDKEKK